MPAVDPHCLQRISSVKALEMGTCCASPGTSCRSGLDHVGFTTALPVPWKWLCNTKNLAGSGSCFNRLCCLCIDRENMSEQLSGSLGR